MKPICPRVQNCYMQAGVEDTPVFMWKYEEGEHMQTAYEIQVCCEGQTVYTTGKVLSRRQNGIKLPLKLDGQSLYRFRVTVWDEEDCPEQSEWGEFLSGVREWKGHWIGNNTSKPFIAKRAFDYIAGEALVLSLCASGQFEVLLNGNRVSNYYYEGSQTDFDKHIQYFTYDLSPFAREGENELTIEVANGWYLGDDDEGRRYFYTMHQGYRPFGCCLTVIAQLRLGQEVLVTDEAWPVSPSQTVLANIYGNEDIDRTRALVWSNAMLLDDKAPRGEIVPFSAPPVIHKKCYSPVAVDRERMIFDFGQNMSSQFRLKIRGNRGQKVRLIPAEKLGEDGDIRQTVDVYSWLTLSGDVDVFEQKFSVNGARWYKVEGADEEQILEFVSFFTTSAAADCGNFSCSDQRLNRIYELVLRAMESNLNHSHTDCPTIEKLGWLETSHLMARSVLYNKEADTLWNKIAMDMRDAQYEEGERDVDLGPIPYEYKEGLIPSIAPRYARFIKDMGEGSFWDIIPWGSSIILAAYEQYRMCGNLQVLEENYESAKRYLEYIGDQYHRYRDIFKVSSKYCFIRTGLGDWGIRQNKGQSRENIETAFYYHDLMRMAEISALLHRGDEERYLRMADGVKESYNQALLGVHGGRRCYLEYGTGRLTQTNQAIPLAFGMVPEEAEEEVGQTLVNLCEGGYLKCGEIGLVYILRELTKLGQNDLIYQMIMQPHHPSYLRFVQQGETSLPEFWRDDARSRNHDMMGHIVEWLFEGIAGIHSDNAFENVTVSPKPPEGVGEFHCAYDSIRGRISVDYRDGRLSVSSPNNCECRVRQG